MSDFTMEELIILQGGIENLPIFINLSDKYKEKCASLLIRLNSMIENYCGHKSCDHEFKRKMMQIDLCEKCNKFKFVFATHQEAINNYSTFIPKRLKDNE